MTDQPKWTPGPWAVNPKAATNVEAGRRGVAACGGYFDNTSDGAYVVENEANAHLIAAAPDMADVLAEVAASLHQTARDRDLSEGELAFMRRVDAALAKARGRA